MTYGEILEQPEVLELDYFRRPGISNSSLSMLNPDQGGSPRKFKSSMSGNFEKKDSLSLERGSLLHLAMLEPELFVVQNMDRPSGMMGVFIEAYYFVYREWEKTQPQGALGIVNPPDPDTHATLMDLAMATSGFKQSASTVWNNFLKPENQAYYDYLKRSTGKISMTKETRGILDNCIASLTKHPMASELLLLEDDDVSTWNEQEVYWTEIVDGYEVLCKAKIDRIRYNQALHRVQQIDLKTTSKSLSHFASSFGGYRYYRQNAFYQKATLVFLQQQGIEKLTLQDVSSINVVVETTALNETAVFKTPESWLKLGREEYSSILARYAWHAKNNLWEYPKEHYQNGGLLLLPELV